MILRIVRLLVASATAVVAATVLAVPSRAQQPPGDTGASFYVAPDGRPTGDGSLQRPWDLQTALNGPATIKPGATIWLRGGTYVGGFVTRLAGRDNEWITIRAYPDERVVLDSRDYDTEPPRAPLLVQSSWLVIEGLEITSSNTLRATPTRLTRDLRPIGINVYAPHTKLVNNIIHDTGNCIGHWGDATDAEIYGNIAFFCGWDAPDRGQAHGIYIQSAGGTKEVVENIFFDTFGFGIHAYTEQGALDDLHFRRNVVFESGMLSEVAPGWSSNILVGGRRVARRPILEDNLTYRTRGNNNLGYRAGTEDAVVTGNTFVEGPEGAALSLVAPKNLSLHDNTFVGPVTRSADFPDNRFLSEGHGTSTFTFPNTWDHDRATIVVYNWDRLPTVAVDAPALLTQGSRYRLRNVQDYFTDFVTSTFTGESLELSMTGRTVATPVGWRAPASTFPTFGVFVLEKLSPPRQP